MNIKKIPLELVRRRLRYEPETGKLFWLWNPEFPLNWNHRRANTEAGAVTNQGYVAVKIDDVSYQVHRLIWAMHNGTDLPPELDHINRDRTDNRIDNLRPADKSVNMRNKSRAKNNTSGRTGVYKDRHKWQARIGGTYLGIFDTFEKAAAAREKAEHENGYTGD